MCRTGNPWSNSGDHNRSNRTFGSEDQGQLVLAGGVAMAFAILMIASMTLLTNEMDADRDVEPSLGIRFEHIRTQFEMAMVYRYNTTNSSTQEVFNQTANMFGIMEFHYGLFLDFTVVSVNGNPGNETLEYRMTLSSDEQILVQDSMITLFR